MNKQLNELLNVWDNIGLRRQFIYDAYDLLIANEQDLIPYINDFQINFFYQPNLGSYNNNERILSVNFNSISDKWIESSVKNRKILTLIVIKHELEHVRQLKHLYEEKQDLESLITNHSLKDFSWENGLLKEYHPREYLWDLKYYKRENYDLDPCERIADIRSWEFINELLKDTDREEYSLSTQKILELYESGYQKTDSPTYQFFKNLHLDKEINEIEEKLETNNYDSNERKLYGLPKVKVKK